MFQFFGEKRDLEKEREVKATFMKKTCTQPFKLRQEEDIILDFVKQNKFFFEAHYAAIYLIKFQQLSEYELKQFAIKSIQNATLYLRQLGLAILKEDVTIRQRILGIMLHDLSDSVNNALIALEDTRLKHSSLEFELLLLLQFVHAYDDYQYIQKEMLCVPFISFKSSFPTDFLIDEVNFKKH